MIISKSEWKKSEWISPTYFGCLFAYKLVFTSINNWWLFCFSFIIIFTISGRIVFSIGHLRVVTLHKQVKWSLFRCDLKCLNGLRINLTKLLKDWKWTWRSFKDLKMNLTKLWRPENELNEALMDWRPFKDWKRL